MTTRYFKADDGERTYFRATKTKAYAGLKPDRYNYRAWTSGAYQWPAVEITKGEYDRLNAAKQPGRAAPQDSWVLSAEIAALRA